MSESIEPRLDIYLEMLDEHESDCALQAKAAAKRLMDERKARRDEPSWEDRGGSLALRVRARGEQRAASFRAEWIIMRRVPMSAKDLELARAGSKQAKFVTRYTTLPKGGRTNTYPSSRLLKHARPWEEELILEIEEEVATLRKQVKLIADLRMRTQKYLKYLWEK